MKFSSQNLLFIQNNISLKPIALTLSSVTFPCWESMVLAQIIPNETLGDESSVVTSDNIKGIESDRLPSKFFSNIASIYQITSE